MKDFYSDNGHLFAAISIKMDSLPTFLMDKEADFEKTASLPDNCFADEEQRLFPISSAEDVYLSAMYLAKQASDDECTEVRERIHKRAAMFGIEEDVSNVESFVKSLSDRREQKTASMPKGAAFVIEMDNPDIRSISGFGPSNACRAESVFWGCVPQMGSEESIKKAASGVVSALESNGCEVSQRLLKFAGTCQRSVPEVKKQISTERIGRISDSLAKSKAKEALLKIESAQDLLDFDKEFGLSASYERGNIDHPMEIFFSGETEVKTASDSTNPLLQSFLDKDVVYDSVCAAFGDERAESMHKQGALDLSEREMEILNQYPLP